MIGNISATDEDVIDGETGEVLKESASGMPAAAKPPKSFSMFLNALENGKTHDDLSKHLQELVADMINHQMTFGNKVVNGSLSIGLDLKLDDGVFTVHNNIKVTKPKRPRGKSIFWATPDNNLIQENPHQRGFDFGKDRR